MYKETILKKEFINIFKDSYITNKLNIINLFNDLVRKYSEPNRYYHNLEHIVFIFGWIKKYQYKIKDYPSLFLAVLFHDSIYDVEKKDNEELSAEYAENTLVSLNFPANKIEKCINLILSTKTHNAVDDDFDNFIFLDADLSILGTEESSYKEYSLKIRKEYGIFPDDVYKEGRMKVLESMLNKPRLFLTNEMFLKLENSARRNIKNEIENLKDIL